ncbi:hypothetical protein EON65_54220 [archaeon]|nr:MAG: hypothetical protein EON65_54220 [archaeon]
MLPYCRTICCLSYSSTSMAVHASSSKITSREVHEFFHAQHLQVLDWPPHSPDLNIIEHVWHYLKEAMRGLTPARSKEELWSNVEVALQYMWSEDMTNKIQTLYESLYLDAWRQSYQLMVGIRATEQQWSWSYWGEKVRWGCQPFRFFRINRCIIRSKL